MAFIALYKCYRGGEWFRASLDGIKNAVDGIVAVFGSSWVDTALPENCKQPLQQFMRDNPNVPVHILDTSHNKQDVQYAIGLDYIRSHWGHASVLGAMIVDTDELWLADDAQALRNMVENTPEATYFTVQMRTYVKSPLYEVFPAEPNNPTVAVNCYRNPGVGVRFSQRRAGDLSKSLRERVMYHYSYVRADFADIVLKFYATESQERVRSNEEWLTTTWKNLPNVSNFHMAKGHERSWQRIRVLRECDVPKGILDLPFIQKLLIAEKVQST